MTDRTRPAPSAPMLDIEGPALAGYTIGVASDRRRDELSGLLEDHGMKLAEQARQQDAVPAALWRRSDALRPLDLCRLARATVSP